jgi:hypothetical protein
VITPFADTGTVLLPVSAIPEVQQDGLSMD